MLHSLPAELQELVCHRLGIQDLSLVSKSGKPAEEDGGDHHPDGKVEMLVTVGNQHRVLAESVYHNIDEAAMEAELYIHCIALEHLEHPVGVFVERFARQLWAGQTVFFANADITHPIHPVGSNTVTLGKGK